MMMNASYKKKKKKEKIFYTMKLIPQTNRNHNKQTLIVMIGVMLTIYRSLHPPILTI